MAFFSTNTFGNYPGEPGNGGAVYNLSAASFVNCQFFNNTAAGGNGGATFMTAGFSGGSAAGGAIYNLGTLNLNNCQFSANGVTGGNGASGNNGNGPGGNASGGAIFSSGGTVTITDCSYSNNAVVSGITGGSRNNFAYRGYARGGAICNEAGTLNLVGLIVVSNSIVGAPAGGGGIYHTNGMLGLSNSVLNANLVLSDKAKLSFVADGSAAQGGALFNGGIATVRDCSFLSNSITGGNGETGLSVAGNGGRGRGRGDRHSDRFPQRFWMHCGRQRCPGRVMGREQYLKEVMVAMPTAALFLAHKPASSIAP